jgi:hypothetical protein
LLIDLGSTFASLVDYSLGAGTFALFSFFRFKSRPSTLLAKAFFLTSERFYVLHRSIFTQCANTYILPEAPHSNVQAPIHPAPISCVVSAYRREALDFQIPSAHPFEAPGVYFPAFASGPVFAAQSTPSPAHNVATFAAFLEEPLYTSASSASWQQLNPIFSRRVGQLYSPYNYYDHFMGYSSLRHSSINLLNLQRNADYRHSHFCTV